MTNPVNQTDIPKLIERLREYAGDWRERASSNEVVLEAAEALSSLQGGGSEPLAYLESEARRFAECYPEGSDGRNTFLIFADKIASTAPRGGSEDDVDAIVANAVAHAERYDTPRDDDPRRRYAPAQMDIAIRNAIRAAIKAMGQG